MLMPSREVVASCIQQPFSANKLPCPFDDPQHCELPIALNVVNHTKAAITCCAGSEATSKRCPQKLAEREVAAALLALWNLPLNFTIKDQELCGKIHEELGPLLCSQKHRDQEATRKALADSWFPTILQFRLHMQSILDSSASVDNSMDVCEPVSSELQKARDHIEQQRREIARLHSRVLGLENLIDTVYIECGNDVMRQGLKHMEQQLSDPQSERECHNGEGQIKQEPIWSHD